MRRWRYPGVFGLIALLLPLCTACDTESVYAYDPVGPRQVLTGPQAQADCQRRGMEAERATWAAPSGNRLPGYHAIYDPCMAEMGWRQRLVSSGSRRGL